MDTEVDRFAQFVEARQGALQRTAWLLTGDWALAEDLVQTALARSWPRWERIRRRDDGDSDTITPDGKTLWVGTGDMVIPITTATNTAGSPIEVGGPLITSRVILRRYGLVTSGLITAMVVTP